MQCLSGGRSRPAVYVVPGLCLVQLLSQMDFAAQRRWLPWVAPGHLVLLIAYAPHLLAARHASQIHNTHAWL